MTPGQYFVGFILLSSIITGILFVLFGQITVSKLRKNSITRSALGFEYVSGWDIINTAQAFAFPSSWSEKLLGSKISFLYANTNLLKENTTKFDQTLGMLFYWTFLLTGFFIILFSILDLTKTL